MARRSRRRLAGFLTLLALAACSPSGGTGTTIAATSTTSQPVTTTSTLPPTTSTSTAVATTTLPDSTTTVPEVDANVRIPDGDGPFPAVVLLHGGGWVSGTPSIMQPLADHLTASGFLTVNGRYTLASLEDPSFPEALDDVACLVRTAASHPQSDGTVAVIGHSAGAHLGAVVALTGDLYGSQCPVDGVIKPDRFVGLAGPYDVSRLGLAMLPFFGTSPSAAPEIWQAGNPQELVSQNPDLDALIMYGELDGLVDDSFAFAFHDALLDAGATSLLELIEGARHNAMHDPALVGDLIVTWLDR